MRESFMSGGPDAIKLIPPALRPALPILFFKKEAILSIKPLHHSTVTSSYINSMPGKCQ